MIISKSSRFCLTTVRLLFGCLVVECVKIVTTPSLTTLHDKVGALINIQNNQGNAPLAWASVSKALRAVKLLVERGAPLDAMNALEQTALDMCYHQHSEIREYLLSKFAPLGAAAKRKLAATTPEQPAAPANNNNNNNNINNDDEAEQLMKQLNGPAN